MGDANSKDITTITFGQVNESVHCSKDEFKRKSISEIASALENTCTRTVRLVPSGMDIQPWYLGESGNRVLLYKQNLKPLFSLVYKKTEVDMGIAFCHYVLARRHFDRPFVFHRREEETNKRGYRLFGELA